MYDCNTDKQLFYEVNKNTRGGYHLKRVFANNSRTEKNKKKINKKGKGVGYIGQGKYSIVFMGCKTKSCKTHVAMGMSSEDTKREFNIQKKLYTPKLQIVKPLGYVKCQDKYITYSEYFNAGSLSAWLSKVNMKNHPNAMKSIIYQVISTLQTINKKYPDFRHNDLHTDNIFIDDERKKGVRVGIGDFGFATMGSSPVNNEYKTDWGVFKGNNKMYDVHLFLNFLYKDRSRLPKSAIDFIKRVVPSKYMGFDTTHIKNHRFRHNIDHSKFPSFNEILSDPYFFTVLKDKVMSGQLSATQFVKQSVKSSPLVRKNVLKTLVNKKKTTVPNYLRLLKQIKISP